MSNMEISPEDRERLAKSKFIEWANEWFAEAGPTEFKKWLEEARRPPTPGQPVQPQATSEQPLPPRPQRKRNLLEMALSDTFGF